MLGLKTKAYELTNTKEPGKMTLRDLHLNKNPNIPSIRHFVLELRQSYKIVQATSNIIQSPLRRNRGEVLHEQTRLLSNFDLISTESTLCSSTLGRVSLPQAGGIYLRIGSDYIFLGPLFDRLNPRMTRTSSGTELQRVQSGLTGREWKWKTHNCI